MITTRISKLAMYRDLCDEVKDSYIQRTGSKEDQKDKVYMLGCNSCQEINLWTYWQGRGNVGKNIKILLQLLTAYPVRAEMNQCRLCK